MKFASDEYVNFVHLSWISCIGNPFSDNRSHCSHLFWSRHFDFDKLAYKEQQLQLKLRQELLTAAIDLRISNKSMTKTLHRKSLWGENLKRKSKFVKWSNRWIALDLTCSTPRPSQVHSLVLHFIACTFAPFQLQTITIKCVGRRLRDEHEQAVKVQENALAKKMQKECCKGISSHGSGCQLTPCYRHEHGSNPGNVLASVRKFDANAGIVGKYYCKKI